MFRGAGHHSNGGLKYDKGPLPPLTSDVRGFDDPCHKEI